MAARVIIDITYYRKDLKTQMDDTQRENWLQKMYTCLQSIVWAHNISAVFTPVSNMSKVHGRNLRSAANCDLYVPLGRHKEVHA